MKAYTDLEQSKMLSEFLSLDSADMCYVNDGTSIKIDANPYNVRKLMWKDYVDEVIPCWSLAALLVILQKTAYFIDEDANVMLDSYKTVEWDLGINNSDLELVTESNPVDACYEMIVKLNELKLL